jgi:hypothetical protein
MLVYPGIKFVFNQNGLLSKVIILNEDASSSIARSLCQKKCQVLLNHGIQFYFCNDLASMAKRIYFGQPMVEVLERLGPPNKEYHRDNCFFLNYFELGVDV